MAAAAAVVVGEPGIQDMLLAALDGSRDWGSLEREWDETAGFEVEEFIEPHAADFFIDE